MAASNWHKDAIFYELYVRAFYDSNGDGHGDLPGVIDRLDYLQELGVTCIWLLPINDSPLVDDGYDVRDYRKLLPKYGTLADFERLIAEAHRRGIRIITDLVLNHTSDQHEWFQQSRSSRDNPYRNWYVWSDAPDKYSEATIIFKDTQPSNWTFDPIAGQYFWHRFYPEQPDLNYDNPAVERAMLDVVDYWLSLGVDGFRCDAVPHIYEREGTDCDNLPETHAFLKRLHRHIAERYPDAILLGEANVTPEQSSDYMGGAELDMAFDFPQMMHTFLILLTKDATPLHQLYAIMPPVAENVQWATFLRNHDEMTVQMLPLPVQAVMNAGYAPLPEHLHNWGIRRRLAPLLDNDHARIELANAIMMALPGSPVIYYGDEIGMGDDLRLPDRNGVRTSMQWSDAANGGFSTASTTFAPVIDDDIYGYERVNVAAQADDPQSLYSRMRELIAVRKAHPAFGRGSIRFYETDNPSLLVFEREYQGKRILCLYNLVTQGQAVQLPTDFAHADLLPLTGTGTLTAELVELQGSGYLWLLISERREANS